MKSLYKKPIKNEKKPIIVIKYQISLIPFMSDFFIESQSAIKIMMSPSINKIPPCPMSPNITPNRNGKVII